MYFQQLHKSFKNPDDFPDGIKDIQLKLGLDVGLDLRGVVLPTSWRCNAKRSAEQQELYDKLKLFLDKYRGKTRR